MTVIEAPQPAITVFGAVRNPKSFQAPGSVTLLECNVTGGRLSENRASVIEVSHSAIARWGPSVPLVERVQVNLRHGSFQTRHPISRWKVESTFAFFPRAASTLWAMSSIQGRSRSRDGPESTVLKAVMLSGGLDSYTFHTAYIYRLEAGSQGPDPH